MKNISQQMVNLAINKDLVAEEKVKNGRIGK
jgi:hypothetical protein